MTKNVMNNVKKWSCVAFWVALFTLYSYWTWTSQLNDFGGDSAVYLLTAQHWSLWGEVNPAAAYFALTTSAIAVFGWAFVASRTSSDRVLRGDGPFVHMAFASTFRSSIDRELGRHRCYCDDSGFLYASALHT
jgi:hypothetical protein